jgi:hypothetical protein
MDLCTVQIRRYREGYMFEYTDKPETRRTWLVHKRRASRPESQNEFPLIQWQLNQMYVLASKHERLNFTDSSAHTHSITAVNLTICADSSTRRLQAIYTEHLPCMVSAHGRSSEIHSTEERKAEGIQGGRRDVYRISALYSRRGSQCWSSCEP